MTKQELHLCKNLNKAFLSLTQEKQEILLWIIFYDKKMYEMEAHFGITSKTLKKKIRLIKEEMFNKAMENYKEDEEDIKLLFEKVKDLIVLQLKNGECND